MRQLPVTFRTAKTLKDLKRFQGHHGGGEESVFDQLDSSDFTEIHVGVKFLHVIYDSVDCDLTQSNLS